MLEPIGKAGMGEVVLADDTELERKAVLTFLPEALQTDSTARKVYEVGETRIG